MSTANMGIIPFFIPHVGCPHICIFCNQPNISGVSKPMDLSLVLETIREYVEIGGNHRRWEVAFYGGSFTSLPKALQEQLLQPAKEALDLGLIDGIRCSTRPDAIDESTVEFLRSYGVCTVELGVQTMDDDMLRVAQRGHSAEDVRIAAERLHNGGITVGLQVLPGLPGENWRTIVKTIDDCARMKPTFLRIYPVLVIEHTELARMYEAGTYVPLSLPLALAYSSAMKTYAEMKGISVIRTGLQATEEFDAGVGLIAGPYEPAMGELVVNEQYRQALEASIHEYIALYRDCKSIVIRYSRGYTSKVRGLKNRNKEYLAKTYPGLSFQWKEWNAISHREEDSIYTTLLQEGYVLLEMDHRRYVVKYSEF